MSQVCRKGAGFQDLLFRTCARRVRIFVTPVQLTRSIETLRNMHLTLHPLFRLGRRQEGSIFGVPEALLLQEDMMLSHDITSVVYTITLVYCCFAASAMSSSAGKPPLLALQATRFSSVGLLTDDYLLFSMSVRPQPDTRVDALSRIFIVVEALATIALQVPRGRTPQVFFRLSGYPTVAVNFSPKHPATDMTNELAN